MGYYLPLENVTKIENRAQANLVESANTFFFTKLKGKFKTRKLMYLTFSISFRYN